MQRPGRKAFYAFCALAIVYILACLVVVQANKHTSPAKRQENADWVASSRYWVDRQLCSFFGLCGGYHIVNTAGWVWDHSHENQPPTSHDYSKFWISGEQDPDSWSKDERRLREIPQYVLDYAPYVHLFSREEYWPSDIAEHLEHTMPFMNHSRIEDLSDPRDLTNLRDLNKYDGAENGRFIYLTSNDNTEAQLDWLSSTRNIPSIPSPQRADYLDTEDDDLESHDQQVLLDMSETDAAFHAAYDRTPSTNARCGGGTGFTCKGSGFGQCCSIYGWCGSGPAHCADPCDPLAGSCYSPYAPPRGPRPDLRRRSVDEQPEAEKHKHKPDFGGRSSAPAFLIVVPKADGVVDAHWFFFYSFNLGQKVLNMRFGNHLGDWEHTTVRFVNGTPTEVFLSEHEFGDAYTWKAMEKYLPAEDGTGTMIGTWSNATASALAKRPVVYSAIGSHAMYGTPGLHPYIIPFGLLHDETDRGPLWDPTLNLQSYTYDPHDQTLRASLLNPRSPTGWFDFAGHWGDRYAYLDDPRQYRLAGQYHYVNGPLGPKFKNLGRTRVCQNGEKPCVVKDVLKGQWRPRPMLPDDDEGEPGGLPGGNHTDEAFGKVDLR